MTYDDPLERLHKANRARILKGAKEGKYWLLRSESMNEHTREELIRKIIETTMASAIGGRSMPFASGGDFNRKGDIAFGARNKVAPAMERNARRSLGKSKSRVHPEV